MEASRVYYGVGVGLGLVVVILASTIWRFLNLVWFEPKKIEKSLRAQGLKGSSYKFMFGDLKEICQMEDEAKSKPIDLNNDIMPRVMPFILKSVDAYGKICFTWMGSKPVVHISEPTMVKEVLTNYHQFQKSRGGNPLMRMLVKGLIDVEGEQWVKHRKIISPAFHIEKLKHMVPAFYLSCNEMINKWEEILTEETSCEVDVWPYLQTMTNDVISRAVFGNSFKEGKRIFELQQKMTELILKSPHSTYIPGSRYFPSKQKKEMKEIDQNVKTSIKDIINKRVVAMKAGESTNDDLLGMLLNSNYNEIKQDKNTNYGLKTEEIIEECKLFHLAGQETTQSLLVWTMVLLSQHTNWQTHARDEVLKVFGDKEPDFEGLSHLKVVNSIFNEVLRLYPPATNLARIVHKQTKVGDITLAPGTLLQISTMFPHHDRDVWGDDVKEFNPGRFFEGIAKATNGQAYCYLPFGGGPRICIGQNFAISEAKITLVRYDSPTVLS